MIKDRLTYYNRLVGPHGERLATLFRFQAKPNSDYPQIYLPFDSLLNHKSRLARETKSWLRDILPASSIEELQLILICHDVGELIHGDISRLSSPNITEETTGVDDLLLPEDCVRLEDFIKAQNYLEKNSETMPTSGLSLIARILDTIDGNYFAYALLENYAMKVGGEMTDPALQLMIDRSYAYVNKMRNKYRARIAQAVSSYDLDLVSILTRLQEVENQELSKFSQSLVGQNYKVSKLT